MHTVPLRVADMNKPNIPPNAGPEVIDLEPTASVRDDGLLPPDRPDGRPRMTRGSSQDSIYQYDLYWLAAGLIFSICLSTIFANVWQVRYVLVSGRDGPSYYLILISIILEAAVGFTLLLISTSCMESREDALKAVRLYRIIEFMIYIIMILNISITSAMASS